MPGTVSNNTPPGLRTRYTFRSAAWTSKMNGNVCVRMKQSYVASAMFSARARSATTVVPDVACKLSTSRCVTRGPPKRRVYVLSPTSSTRPRTSA